MQTLFERQRDIRGRPEERHVEQGVEVTDQKIVREMPDERIRLSLEMQKNRDRQIHDRRGKLRQRQKPDRYVKICHGKHLILIVIPIFYRINASEMS